MSQYAIELIWMFLINDNLQCIDWTIKNIQSWILTLHFTEDDGVAAKMLSYNRANRAVAILCNHQRAAPKNFSKQMENIMVKVGQKL